MLVLILIFLIFVAINIGFGYLGRWISVQHGRSEVEGFLLGFFLGVLGILIAALLPRPLDVRIREAVVIDQAREGYMQDGSATSSRSLSFMDAVGEYRRVNSPSAEVPANAFISATQARASALRRLPSRDWGAIVEAAVDLPTEQLEAVRATVETLWKTYGGPLTSILGVGGDGRPVIVLVFPDELLVAKCATGYPSLKHFYNGRPCQFVAVQDAAGNYRRIGLGSGPATSDERLHWVVAPHPQDAVVALIDDLRVQPWVNVRIDPLLDEDGSGHFQPSPR